MRSVFRMDFVFSCSGRILFSYRVQEGIAAGLELSGRRGLLDRISDAVAANGGQEPVEVGNNLVQRASGPAIIQRVSSP